MSVEFVFSQLMLGCGGWAAGWELARRSCVTVGVIPRKEAGCTGLGPGHRCGRWIHFHWFLLVLRWVHLHGLHAVVWRIGSH